MPREIELREFAIRVERLCDFILSKTSSEPGKTNTEDLAVIRELKEDAADIQHDRLRVTSKLLVGLDNYMRGIHNESSSGSGQ